VKSATFEIPLDIRQYLADTSLTSVTFQYSDPVHALIGMLHFNPLAADWNNLCFTYEESDFYDDFCNGERVKRIHEAIPPGSGQLNAIMYFDGIQQDESGFTSVDGGIVQGAFFRRAAREQNEAMKSICSFVEVRMLSCMSYRCVCIHAFYGGVVGRMSSGRMHCVRYLSRRRMLCSATRHFTSRTSNGEVCRGGGVLLRRT
jgi:hypothetical protein